MTVRVEHERRVVVGSIVRPQPRRGYQALYAAGIQAAFSLTSGPSTLQEACANAASLLEDRAQDITRLWLAARHHVI